MTNTSSVPQTALSWNESGQGEPVLLLHALGLSHDTWSPLVPELRTRYRVFAPDLPGHGTSASVSDGSEPTPARLARVIADAMTDLGIDKMHVVGNSIGGWVALELAKLDRAKSLTLIAPAGLWTDNTPLASAVALLAMRTLTRRAPRLVQVAARNAVLRRLLFAGSVGRPGALPAAAAARMAADLGSAPQFPAIFRATLQRHFEGGGGLEIPVTVLFGTRDRILGAGARSPIHLPTHTRAYLLPGAGHVPMWDAPAQIIARIDATVRRAPGSRSRLRQGASASERAWCRRLR
ncbi:alpha/beta fold hydrolase [Antrihabitans cavernicola]|uniref:Alpha/beta fold hydrolase n=1 Tax=Antrihabitans cavernicola TaxID=2495913 RepID=A0A5A7SAE1_9NOCA|nr:alpha/beta fold hydrolase [Spelaeibacter cavernicola]KAA0022152.1 alpha/beta fold hydrolase [Spelaeibacter cavernicola]